LAALAGCAFVVLYGAAFALGIEVGDSDREILANPASAANRSQLVRVIACLFRRGRRDSRRRGYGGQYVGEVGRRLAAGVSFLRPVSLFGGKATAIVRGLAVVGQPLNVWREWVADRMSLLSPSRPTFQRCAAMGSVAGRRCPPAGPRFHCLATIGSRGEARTGNGQDGSSLTRWTEQGIARSQRRAADEAFSKAARLVAWGG